MMKTNKEVIDGYEGEDRKERVRGQKEEAKRRRKMNRTRDVVYEGDFLFSGN